MQRTPDLKDWPAHVEGKLGNRLAEAMKAAEDEQIALFEREAANQLFATARRGRIQAFGPERVLSYLVMLSREMYNLNLVVSGRFNRIHPDLLRGRLRETYA